jgi:autotransporter-associated beta strand protein
LIYQEFKRIFYARKPSPLIFASNHQSSPIKIVKTKTSPPIAVALLVALVALLSINLRANTWIAPATGQYWTGGTNWLEATAPNSLDAIADFSLLDITSDTTAHLDAPQTVGSLLFGDLDPFGSPANWTLDNNGNVANTLTLGTSAGLPTLPTITVNDMGTNRATVTATLTGNNGLAKLGPGTLALSSLTYSGPTAFSNGTVVLGAANALPTSTDLYLGTANDPTISASLDLSNFSQTVGSLSTVGIGTLTNTITIASGQTLTVHSNVLFGYRTTGGLQSNVVSFVGGGSLVADTSANGGITNNVFMVGAYFLPSSGGTACRVDMSGLSSLTINLGTGLAGNYPQQANWPSSIMMGDPYGSFAGNAASTWILASNNTFNANNLTVGMNRYQAGVQTLIFGSGANVFNVASNGIGSIPASGKREGGVAYFATSTGTLKIRGQDGSSRANLFVGASGNGALAPPLQYLDLNGHNADLFLSNLYVGFNKYSGNGSNYMNFSDGTIDTTFLQIGVHSGASGPNSNFITTVNFTGGTVTVGASGVTMGNCSGTAVTITNTTTLNVSGSTMTVGGNMTIGTQNSALGTLLSTLNITSSLTVTGNVVCGAGTASPGPRTVKINLNGPNALLDLTGHAIGGTTAASFIDQPIFASGTLQNVGQINNGTYNLVLNSGSTLTIAGSNSYSGLTVVSNGTLVVNGILGTNTVAAYGGTLRAAGQIRGSVVVANSASFKPGLASGIGALIINKDLTLGSASTTTMRLSRDTGVNNDTVTGIGNFTAGGALTVTDIGTTQLSPGDTFTLFGATAYLGNFSVVNLPNGNIPVGYGWDASQLGINGTIKVVPVTQPALNPLTPMNVECGSGSVTFVAQATGGLLHYDWTVNGSPVANNDSPAFTTNSVHAAGSVYTIAVTVHNTIGSANSSTTLTVIDTTGPTVTINGTSPILIPVYGSYTELGATALDACAGATAVDSTNSTVNTGVVGTYTVTYTAHDANLNTNTAIRIVQVSGNAYWTNNTSDEYWQNAYNWTNGFIPNSGEYTADFTTMDIVGDLTEYISSPVRIGGLNFGDANTGTAGGWRIQNFSGVPLVLAGTNGNPRPTVTVNALGGNKVATLDTVVDGTNGLAKAGVGTLVLTMDNTYTGGTTITNGILQLGEGLAVGSVVGNIVDNGTLLIARGDQYPLTNNIIGTGSFGVMNNTTVTVNNPQTYGGMTQIREGTIVVGVANALPTNTMVFLGGSNAATAGNLDLSVNSQTIGGLTTGNPGGNQQVITVGAGNNLTVNGSVITGFGTANANGPNTVEMTGGGTLTVNTNGGAFQVSANNSQGGTSGIQTTFDLSGLASATVNLGTNGNVAVGDQLGDGGDDTSTLLLAPDTTLTAGTLKLGISTRLQLQTLILGSGNNVFNITTNWLGGGRDWGQMYFTASTGSLKMRAADGVGRAQLAIATIGGTSLGGGNQYVDLSGAGHSADLLLSVLSVGTDNRSFPGSAYENMFAFQNGTVDATGIIVGQRVGSVPNVYWANHLNLLGGTTIVGTNGITMASFTTGVGSFNSTNFADVNVAGTLTVNGNISLLNQQQSTNNAYAFGTLNINSGSVTVNGDILCNGTVTNPGPRLATIILNGGLLDLSGHTIGGTNHNPVNYVDVLDLESGTIQNLGELNGGTTPFVMNVFNTITIRGNNTYSGGTIASNGTIEAGSDGALGLGDVRVAGGGLILDSGTANSYINPAASLRIDNGAQQVNLSYSGAPNHIANLYFGGVAQANGTWGSSASGATHTDDTHFTGTGTLLVTASSSIALTSTPNPATVGQTVQFTATVTGGSGTPAGTVTFKNGATPLSTNTLNGSGIATFTTSALLAGTNQITTVYNGSTTYSPVTSTILLQTVNAPTPSSAPNFVSAIRSGNNLILVSAGATNGSYKVLTSTNVALPIVSWDPLVTNTVGADGLSTNTLPISSTESRRFYLLSLP